MSKHKWVLAWAGIAVGVGVLAWAAMGRPRGHSLSPALWQEVRRGPGVTVDFNRIAPFAWDRLFIFGPYTPHERIHQRLGFRWDGAAQTTIYHSDGVNLVVFVRGEAVVSWFEHPRGQGDLVGLADANGYAPGEARFLVCRDPEGRLVLTK